MATTPDGPKNDAGETTQIAQEALRRYVDESAALGRSYLTAWSATAQASLRTAFEVQNAALQATRALFDSTVQADRGLLDQLAQQMKQGQDTTTRVVGATFDLLDSALLKGRG